MPATILVLDRSLTGSHLWSICASQVEGCLSWPVPLYCRSRRAWKLGTLALISVGICSNRIHFGLGSRGHPELRISPIETWTLELAA